MGAWSARRLGAPLRQCRGRLLRFTGIAPLHRYYGPIRRALAFAALRLSARATTLLPRAFSAGLLRYKADTEKAYGEVAQTSP